MMYAKRFGALGACLLVALALAGVTARTASRPLGDPLTPEEMKGWVGGTQFVTIHQQSCENLNGYFCLFQGQPCTTCTVGVVNYAMAGTQGGNQRVAPIINCGNIATNICALDPNTLRWYCPSQGSKPTPNPCNNVNGATHQ